jgi:hypothetical protein
MVRFLLCMYVRTSDTDGTASLADLKNKQGSARGALFAVMCHGLITTVPEVSVTYNGKCADGRCPSCLLSPQLLGI